LISLAGFFAFDIHLPIFESEHLRLSLALNGFGCSENLDRLVFGCSEFSLWWIAFQDFGPVLVAYHEDSKSFNVLQFVATSLRVFDLATDVGIAVTEEELFVGGLVEAEDFDVDAGERFAGDCMRNLEFTVAFQGGDL